MNRIAPTLRQIREAHSWKREYEKFLPVSRYFFRPAGFLVTWLFIRMGLTSEGVSWLSALVGLAGCFFLTFGGSHWVLAGVAFLFLFNLLDCVDGSIARTMQTQNPYGRFLDSICGGIVDLFFWFAVGIALSRSPNLIFFQNSFGYGPFLWALAGAATGFLCLYHGYLERAFDELLRKYWDGAEGMREDASPAVLDPAPESPPYSGPIGLLRMISMNLGVRETQYVLMLVAFWAKAIDLLLIFYFAFYLAQNLFLLLTYCRRGRIVKRNVQRIHNATMIKS